MELHAGFELITLASEYRVMVGIGSISLSGDTGAYEQTLHVGISGDVMGLDLPLVHSDLPCQEMGTTYHISMFRGNLVDAAARIKRVG